MEPLLNPIQKVIHDLRIICISKKVMAPGVAPAFWVIRHDNTKGLTFIVKKTYSLINSLHYSDFSLKIYALIHIFASHLRKVKYNILNSRTFIKLVKPKKLVLFVYFPLYKQQTKNYYQNHIYPHLQVSIFCFEPTFPRR